MESGCASYNRAPIYSAASSYAMYTTVLSVAIAPSVGSRCTKPVTRSADCQNGSRSSPSIVTGCESRTARTCCGATGAGGAGSIGGGESTAAGWIPASARSNWSVVVMVRPELRWNWKPRSRTLDGERAAVIAPYDRRRTEMVANEGQD